jgi:hypothetical protein
VLLMSLPAIGAAISGQRAIVTVEDDSSVYIFKENRRQEIEDKESMRMDFSLIKE